ncbi:GAF domain-containing protein [Elizabethkingia argentiflava]|uniref:GAF domain-containing protein n=1 Tax=Elizabethkingia argenteiflava TaxID=2681556 RepID=A0A845Q1P2_9FLAO|nr:GAF domain-containing protein [Elizabethkingia argenteiflava]NAW52250.1 GAF domain-containing protein [Elizabethkingia argenteiflava]
MIDLKQKLSSLLAEEVSIQERLQKICAYLSQEISYYNWIGFYFRDGEKEELMLGPYVGEHTDHTRIPFGKGICGQVAVSGSTFVVPDVAEQENYLACSLDTKAEIVVPIFKDAKNIGQIDIDSHSIDPFTKEDTELLEWLSQEVAKIL